MGGSLREAPEYFIKNAGGGEEAPVLMLAPWGWGKQKKQKKLKLAPKWMSSKLCILNFYTEFEFPHQFF